MTKLYSGKDVDKKALKKARIAILGYGSQGRAHALNLADSGHNVVVGVQRPDGEWLEITSFPERLDPDARQFPSRVVVANVDAR